MRCSQKILYVCEQLGMLEKAIVNQSHEEFKEAFNGKGSLTIGEPGFVKVLLYENFMSYEGPLIARYMIVIQLYSLFERYSISFSKDLSRINKLINIKDLNGSQSFKGIKTYFTKVNNIHFTQWLQIDQLRLVRNLVAHSDGYVTYSEQKSKIEKLVYSHQDLILLSDGRIAMNEKFLKNSIRAIMEFFDIVESMISEPDNLLDFSWAHVEEFINFNNNK